ncbi:MAG: helix-turn-helix transcriptional regulator [Aeromicrobium sp.]|uniref:helix-turn-helix domain-containing protein n=1 Tax=Aeromicrobium sp. TaxID=1871063 RepID=UPI0039E4FADD
MGDRLRKARQMTGLTTRAFAERIGVSQATVTNAENDNNKVRRITLNAWSLATGVPVEWLETGNAPSAEAEGASGADDGTRTRNILLGSPGSSPTSPHTGRSARHEP